MTWRRRSDCTVSALGVGRGTRRGWWHGTRLVMTVSQDLAVGLVDSEAVAEGVSFLLQYLQYCDLHVSLCLLKL